MAVKVGPAAPPGLIQVALHGTIEKRLMTLRRPEPRCALPPNSTLVAMDAKLPAHILSGTSETEFACF